MSTPALKRVVRRETHSPRSVAMIIAVTVLILALAYVGVETVLYLAGQPALLLGPVTGLGWLIGLPSQPVALTIVGAVVLAVIGVVLIVLAVSPGRLPRQEAAHESRAVVIDNGVIAAALAQRVATETGIPRDRVRVGVSHRTADVTVEPGAGVPLTRDEVRVAADDELSGYGLARPLRVRVRINRPTEREQES